MSVISREETLRPPSAKMAVSDLHRYPINLYIFSNLKDIAVFPGLEVFNSDNSYMFSSALEIQFLLKQKSVFKIINIAL